MCKHDNLEYRVKTYSDGSIHVITQCMDCFAERSQPLPHEHFAGLWLDQLAKPKGLFDDPLPEKIKIPGHKQFGDNRHTQRMKRARKEVAGFRCEWVRGSYASIGFAMTQAAGMDDWRCLNTQHLEVHHLTYARVGHERLDDLQCLCRFHHRQVVHDFEPD